MSPTPLFEATPAQLDRCARPPSLQMLHSLNDWMKPGGNKRKRPMTVTIIDTSATSEQDHGHQGFPLYDPYYLPHQRPSRCATPRTTHRSALRAFRCVHYVDLSVRRSRSLVSVLRLSLMATKGPIGLLRCMAPFYSDRSRSFSPFVKVA